MLDFRSLLFLDFLNCKGLVLKSIHKGERFAPPIRAFLFAHSLIIHSILSFNFYSKLEIKLFLINIQTERLFEIARIPAYLEGKRLFG